MTVLAIFLYVKLNFFNICFRAKLTKLKIKMLNFTINKKKCQMGAIQASNPVEVTTIWNIPFQTYPKQ